MDIEPVQGATELNIRPTMISLQKPVLCRERETSSGKEHIRWLRLRARTRNHAAPESVNYSQDPEQLRLVSLVRTSLLKRQIYISSATGSRA
jgi:hypothetical protein